MADVYFKGIPGRRRSGGDFASELGSATTLAALRVRGEWKDAPEMTFGDLEDRYRKIDSPAEVDRLVAEAKKALGR